MRNPITMNLNGWLKIPSKRFTALIKANDIPSPCCINGGRINFLHIVDNYTGEDVAVYDRTWDEPVHDNALAFYEEIIAEYN